MPVQPIVRSIVRPTVAGIVRSFGSSFVSRFGAGLSATYFLADLGSKRGTVDSATNPVVRVRRTNGDLSAFTAANVASGAMLTYVGTGGSDNGQTAKLYDGSGNARDQLQNTVADMPLSVVGGALVAVNSSPALRFNGTSSFLVGDSTDALITDASQPFSMFVVTKMNDLTGVQRILATSDGAADIFKGVALYSNGSSIGAEIIHNNKQTNQSIIVSGGTMGTSQRLISFIYDGSKSASGFSIWLNGEQVTLTSPPAKTTVTSNDIAAQHLRIGANTPTALHAHMDFQFAAVYATANKSADRPAIEAALAKEYNITLA